MSKSLSSTRRVGGHEGLGGERVLNFNELLVKNEWVLAAERDRCSVCALKFTAFRRKHHCRLCGEVLCGSCTMKKEALLPILGVSKVKVCKPCAVSVGQVDFERQDARPSDMSLTIESGDDIDVTQKEIDDLEALISPSATKFEDRGFTGWDIADLRVPWYPAEDLRDIRELSRDEHANVWLVSCQRTRQFVAKRLSKEMRTQQSASDFVEDIKLASKLQHPRIVELVGASWTADRDLQALFEYLPGGDLRAFLDMTRADAFVNTQRMIQKLRIALDIAEGLAYIHSLEQPLHHRALESKNVMLSAEHRAKIGGFGAVRVELATTAGANSSNIARWLAPEVLSGGCEYDAACDIYSLGVILTELDTHMVPFSDCHGPQGNILPIVAILFLISLGQAKPSMSSSCPPEIRQLADECLSFDPERRPTAIDIVARLRAFIRTVGLENTLECKTPQQQQGIVLCEESFL